MPLQTWLAFVFASTVLLVIPGPTILTVISYAIAQGRRASVPLVAAVAFGDATALALSLLGLGALVAASAFWFVVLKTLGGLYLLFLGLRMMRSGRPSTAPSAVADLPNSRWRMFANTYFVTALNPKGIVFFVAFLPQFVSPESDAARQLWLLAATFVLLAIANATLYALFAVSARQLFSSSRALRRFNFVGGSLLSAAGVWALLARRSA